jgi:hypothetical protein
VSQNFCPERFYQVGVSKERGVNHAVGSMSLTLNNFLFNGQYYLRARKKEARLLVKKSFCKEEENAIPAAM